MDTELMKQMGVFAFALVALGVLWRFGKMMLLKFVSVMERQLENARADALEESKRCHEEFSRQAMTFAKALDKRDEQTDEIVKHLQEQTATMKTIADQTGKIVLKVDSITVRPVVDPGHTT